MPFFSFFSSTIPPLIRPLSPFSRARQQAQQSQRRPSQPRTRAPSQQHLATSSPSSPSSPPPRFHSHPAQTLTLHFHPTTSLILSNNQPVSALFSPPMTNTLPTSLTCPTCAATEVRELFNVQGHRRAAVCRACFSRFAEREVEAREDRGLTSFPRLMEIVDKQVAMETGEVETLAAGRGVGTTYGLERVFGGLQLFKRRRRDSMFSEGMGSSSVDIDGE